MMKLNFIDNKELQYIEKKLEKACSIFDFMDKSKAIMRIEMAVMRAAFRLCLLSINQTKKDPNKYLLECSFYLKIALGKIGQFDVTEKSLSLIVVEETCKEVLKIVTEIRL